MTKDELQKFCADDEPVLRAPWSWGEFTYATNRHIIVRVARLGDVAEKSNTFGVAAERLFSDAPSADFIPVPACEMPPDIPCIDCEGTGVWHEEGEEDEKCEWCNGSGVTHSAATVSVGGVWFNQRYIAMLQGWEIAPLPVVDYGQKASHIRNGAAYGLLMPVKK